MSNFLKFITALVLIFISTEVVAQKDNEYTVNVSSGKLILEDFNELVVQGYSGSNIKFSAETDDDEFSERAKGLRLINNSGLSDNTGLGISVSQESNVVRASQISGSNEDRTLTVYVPKGVDVSVSHSSTQAETIYIKDFSKELEISSNYHDIVFENVTGPMAVKTVYGSIDGSFNSVSQNGSISLYSVYEFVDISLPTNAKANLSLTANYGDVYSNVDIKVQPKKNNKYCNASCNHKSSCNHNKQSCGSSSFGTEIFGTMNGGGVDFAVKSSYENVYLRAK